MNYSVIKNILGKLMFILAALLGAPLLVSFVYQEGMKYYLSYIIPIVVLVVLGVLCILKKPKHNKMLAREGFVIVSLSWVVISLFGALPFMISGEIPNFFDAFFEIVSGFSTTGATILEDVTDLSKSIQFWRSFSHWIGGMGILVFVLMIIPESKEGSSMHILRAESPGPQVGKLVSRMQVTSRILYMIYIALTVLQIVVLWIGPDEKMTFFNSIIYSIGTAGTGGFGIDADSLASYSAYSQYVVAVFMFVFGINFSLFYFILIGNIKDVLKNEELRLYIGIVLFSIITIMINIYSSCKGFEEAFRLSFFQVGSITSTTGYATVNFDLWPTYSKIILLILLVFGGCAGSTAGGFKLARVNILLKSSIRKIKNYINPRKVEVCMIDGKPITEEVVESTKSYFVIYMLVFIVCSVIISFDNFDMITTLTASLTCLNNVGPGFSMVGPIGNFASFSGFSKLVLSFEMIAGRLELIPILILFSPATWKKI